MGVLPPHSSKMEKLTVKFLATGRGQLLICRNKDYKACVVEYYCSSLCGSRSTDSDLTSPAEKNNPTLKQRTAIICTT